MLLKIYQTGQPVLRKKARPVSEKLLASRDTQLLIDSMIETMRDVPGVGLAAPQVGQSLRIIVIDDKAKYHKQVPTAMLEEQGRRPVALKVLVNPEIEILDTRENTYFEGCLSVDGYVGVVSRADTVRVKATDRHGKAIGYVAAGWHARILQHEIGHLDGELYIDHAWPKSFISLKNFTEFWRDALQGKIERSFKR